MGNRGFCSYAHLALLKLKGVCGVFRIHQEIKVEFLAPGDPASEGATACKGRLPRWLHRLGAMDQLVEWIKRKKAPKSMTADEYARSCPDVWSCVNCGTWSGGPGSAPRK